MKVQMDGMEEPPLCCTQTNKIGLLYPLVGSVATYAPTVEFDTK